MLDESDVVLRAENLTDVEELELMRQHLELAIEGAQLGVWSFNPRTSACWFSDRAKTLLGLESNFLPDATAFRERVHPDDWGRLIAPYMAPYPRQPLAIEYRVVMPDGDIRWIYGLGAAIRDEEDVPQTVHGILMDITDRKEGDEELEDSRRRLELAVEGAKLGTWTYDLRTGKTWYSDRSKQMYGLPLDAEMTTEVIRNSVHPDHWEEVADPYLNGFKEDRVEVEYRVTCPDGSRRWIYSLGAANRDEKGVAHTVNGIHLDITERKQAEEDLAETRRQLELAVEGAKLGSWTVNPETGATWYSDRSRDLHGLDKELRLDAKTLKSYIHPDDWDLVIDSYRKGFPGDSIELEHRVVWPNGEQRWVQSIGTALRDKDGKVETVSGIHLDITERKKAEEDLAEARRQLELAVEGARLGLWSVDPNTGAVWHSDISREMWGMTPDEPIDVAVIKERVHPDDWPVVREPYRQGFPQKTVSIEHRVVWPNGEVRWLHALGRAQRDAETGEVTMVTGIHLDITARKEAEAELQRSRDALHESEKLAAMGSLLAGVSHELNNPLAAIVGQAEMLEEDAAGTVFEARAKKISSAAERCAKIVQTFLAMARRKEPQRGLVDVNDIIHSALDLTDYGLRTAGISVQVTFGSQLPPVDGDRDQLHQVLVNLIINAQQAMEDGELFDKTLTIRTALDGGKVVLEVSDTGPGIPEKARGRIFDPFFTTKLGTGTGLGLAFSQGIVEAHGGTLTLQPSRRGASFRITLPPAPVGSELLAVPIEPERQAPVNGGRALIVEDEADVAETLCELLEREGYQVTYASDGAAALMALDREDFDLIVSDLRMPGVSGPDLHARLSETRPHLVAKMGFVTGDTLGTSMNDFLRSCGRPVLEKPFTKVGVRCLIAAIKEEGKAE
ncbi:MAG TPA: PAS domain-containing protein [Allosphingosinicella sp.]